MSLDLQAKKGHEIVQACAARSGSTRRRRATTSRPAGRRPMNEFVQTLWQEFAAESDEHLAVLEPLLVRLGSVEGEAGDVARLFRGFHSLKGLARAMALYGMEAVAHRAEKPARTGAG
jgi:Chemotaxis protein histidine kinase and related kinases